jgi:hypothetical protein
LPTQYDFRAYLKEIRKALDAEGYAVELTVNDRKVAHSGAELATTVVRRHVILHLQHHDQASLLTGKLHAILQRAYLKGRDIYDLLWFLSDPDWPGPNLRMLNNALQQTGWEGPTLIERSWRAVVRDRLQNASWNRVVDDVRPFLEPRADPSILSYENVMQVLERR